MDCISLSVLAEFPVLGHLSIDAINACWQNPRTSPGISVSTIVHIQWISIVNDSQGLLNVNDYHRLDFHNIMRQFANRSSIRNTCGNASQARRGPNQTMSVAQHDQQLSGCLGSVPMCLYIWRLETVVKPTINSLRKQRKFLQYSEGAQDVPKRASLPIADSRNAAKLSNSRKKAFFLEVFTHPRSVELKNL